MFLRANQSHHLEHKFTLLRYLSSLTAAQKGVWTPEEESVQRLLHVEKTLIFCLASREIKGVL